MMAVFKLSLTIIITWYAVFEGLVISADLIGKHKFAMFEKKLSSFQYSQDILNTMVIRSVNDLAQEILKRTLLEASQLQLRKSLAQETEKRTLIEARCNSLQNGLSYEKHGHAVLADQLTQLKGVLKDHQDMLQKALKNVSLSCCAPSSRKIKAVRCPKPPDIVNGQRTGGRSFGETMVFSCRTGYEISGESELTCQDNGEWDNPYPSCDNPNPPTPSTYYTVSYADYDDYDDY